MIRRRPIQTIEETVSLQALIVADKHQELITHLTKVLTTRGCSVKTVSHNEILHGEKFDYIFQLSDYSSAVNFFHKNLSSGGKFLFVEADTEEVTDKEKLPFKILRIGNSSLWTTKELADKILKTNFSTSLMQIVDARKGHLVKPTPVRNVIKRRPTSPSQVALVSKKLIWKNKLIILLFLLLAAVLLSGGYFFWSLISLKNTLSEVKVHFTASNWNEAGSNLEKAKKKVIRLKKAYDFFWTLFIPLRDTAFVRDTGVLLTVTYNLLTSGNDFITTYQTDTFEIMPQVLTKSEKKIIALSQAVDDAKKRVELVTLPFFPKEDTLRFLTSIQSSLANASNILPVLKEMFLTDQAKTYAVLFQNNMELRPTGGFIGSFALMTVQEGKVLDLKIMDVYSADGQLKGHVDPPIPIRKYLSQPNFFLRDSNFDPDFGKSGATALWFIQKELGKSVDGVIGINLYFVQELLRLTGPLTLPDFNNETVTSDNFFFKAQFYAQNEFFPGSTQKRDFLTAVSNILQLKLMNMADIPLLDLVATVKNSLDEKNFLLWSSEANTQKLIEEKGWGGRMVAVECVGDVKNCKADYLAISEANLGVNKANYFITKSVTIGKEVDGNGDLKTTVMLSYENRNIGDIFSGGIYVNYLRFFLPVNSVFDSLTLNNAAIPISEIDTESYGGDKTSYGYLLRIAPENKAVVKIIYTLHAFLTTDVSSYQFLFQKQPGDKISPLILSVVLPEGFKMQPLNFKSTSHSDNELFFTTDTSVDRIFALGRE